MKKLIAQILRFGVTGFIAFCIDYGTLFALVEFAGIHYLIASGISFCVSVIFNYLLSIYWVFDTDKDKDAKGRAKELVVFMVLSTIGLGINQVVMYTMVDLLGVHYLLSKLVATAIVMVYNFITRKIFLEKKPASQELHE